MTAVFAKWVSMISKLWYHQYHTDQINKKFVASEKFLQFSTYIVDIEIWMDYFYFTSYDDRLHSFHISFLNEVCFNNFFFNRWNKNVYWWLMLRYSFSQKN